MTLNSQYVWHGTASKLLYGGVLCIYICEVGYLQALQNAWLGYAKPATFSLRAITPIGISIPESTRPWCVNRKIQYKRLVSGQRSSRRSHTGMIPVRNNMRTKYRMIASIALWTTTSSLSYDWWYCMIHSDMTMKRRSAKTLKFTRNQGARFFIIPWWQSVIPSCVRVRCINGMTNCCIEVECIALSLSVSLVRFKACAWTPGNSLHRPYGWSWYSQVTSGHDDWE